MARMTRKKMAYRTGCLALGCVAFLLMCPGITLSQNLPSEVIDYADMVLYNGRVLTVDEAFSIVEAVAVRDGKFLALGTSQRINQLAGPQTRRIDLQGKTVVPGFIDTHLHGIWVGGKGGVQVSGSVIQFETLEAGLRRLKEVVDRTPPGDWIYVNRTPRSEVSYALTRQDLDKVSPHNPVAMSLSTAEMIVNTLALKLANIPPDFPVVLKDPETGEPTGQIRQAAVGVVEYEAIPWPEDLEPLIERQKELLRQHNALGLTTIIGRASGIKISVLKEIWARKELTARVRVAHEFTMYNPKTEAFLKRVGNLAGFGDSWMKIIGATVGPVDGIGSVGGILTSRPKLRPAQVGGGDVFGSYGQNKWEEGVGEEWEKKSTERNSILMANRYGWNITSQHSLGDQSTTIYLDVYEEANREKPLRGRWGLDHVIIHTPETLARMKELGIIPSVYAKMFNNPEALLWQYGADRVNEMAPVGSMFKMGLNPVAEADTFGDASEFSAPLWTIEKFVTRTDETGREWNREEAISRQDALRMYTHWAAYYSAEEDILGTISPGKLADFVILDGDFMTVQPDRISELPVVMTVVGGQVVYEESFEAGN